MWGYYSFQPKNTAGTISFTQLGSQSQRIARNGVQIADGKLYTVDFERYGLSNGDLTLYTYDISTWKGNGQKYNDFFTCCHRDSTSKRWYSIWRIL